MKETKTALTINESLTVELVRKKMRSMRLTVYPPTIESESRVRVAVPLRTSLARARLFVLSKLDWVQKQQHKFSAQRDAAGYVAPPMPREYKDGELHYFLGSPYVLHVIEGNARQRAVLQDTNASTNTNTNANTNASVCTNANASTNTNTNANANTNASVCTNSNTNASTSYPRIALFVRPNSDLVQRREILRKWYRAQLCEIIPPLVEKWEARIGVEVDQWRIKRMKTRWGTCNISQRRIWLNLELAQKPLHCVEYVVVHEILHLLERYHNARFYGLFDKYMPNWQEHRKELNSMAIC